MIRRLLTYLLIDTSGSMNGEPIEAVNAGIKMLLARLRQNPSALETVHLSVITFDSEIKEVLPLTPLTEINETHMPTIQCPPSGATLLGAGMKKLVQSVERDIRHNTPEQKGDWAPIAMVLTDGKPTDLQEFTEAIPMIRHCKFSEIIGCAAGPKSDPTFLQKFCTQTVSLDTMDGKKFEEFFKWISQSIGVSSKQVGHTAPQSGGVQLPAPPPEINIVF